MDNPLGCIALQLLSFHISPLALVVMWHAAEELFVVAQRRTMRLCYELLHAFPNPETPFTTQRTGRAARHLILHLQKGLMSSSICWHVQPSKGDV